MTDLRQRLRVLDQLEVPDVMLEVDRIGPKAPRPERASTARRVEAILVAAVIVIAAALLIARAFLAPARTPVQPPNPSPSLVQPSDDSPPGFPPPGAAPSRPIVGDLLLRLEYKGDRASAPGSYLYAYADGRLLTQRIGFFAFSRSEVFYQEHQLTPEGLDLLRSEMLATDLFDRSRVFRFRGRRDASLWAQVITSGEPVSVRSTTRRRNPPDRPGPELAANLERLRDIATDPIGALPPEAFVDANARIFVPARFVINIAGPIEKEGVPPFAEGVLRPRHCQIVPTEAARSIRGGFSPEVPLTSGGRPTRNLVYPLSLPLQDRYGLASFEPALPHQLRC